MTVSHRASPLPRQPLSANALKGFIIIMNTSGDPSSKWASFG
ncbi:hypothetical protein BIWAKO_06471 [Bosea sp. BIWAKO-01]|nr:hypothetical protein BIWAKO_06471 [Bosea sp. BIWAKO-01]